MILSMINPKDIEAGAGWNVCVIEHMYRQMCLTLSITLEFFVISHGLM